MTHACKQFKRAHQRGRSIIMYYKEGDYNSGFNHCPEDGWYIYNPEYDMHVGDKLNFCPWCSRKL